MFEFYKDKADEWRWRVMSNNNEIIAASSEGYKNFRDCKNNVQILIKAIFAQALDVLNNNDW